MNMTITPEWLKRKIEQEPEESYCVEIGGDEKLQEIMNKTKNDRNQSGPIRPAGAGTQSQSG